MEVGAQVWGAGLRPQVWHGCIVNSPAYSFRGSQPVFLQGKPASLELFSSQDSTALGSLPWLLNQAMERKLRVYVFFK